MNNNEEQILKEIFAKPTYRFHIRELAKLTNLNPNTIINLSESLVKEGILIREKKKHLTEIYFNFENPKAVTKKKLFNLSKVYDSKIVDFLAKKLEPESISIMGSYSRGQDIEGSDIDVVIISKKEEYPNLSEYEKFLGRKVHLIITHYKKMSEEFYINFINGIVLYGAITTR